MAKARACVLPVALLALFATLLAVQAAGAKVSKASSELLRRKLNVQELSPDQVRDLLLAVDNKRETYVGSASVEFLLTYENISLDRCLRLSQDKESRARFGVCKLAELNYVESALRYCRDRLAKQADLCASNIEDILDWQLKPLTEAETKAVSALTASVLDDKPEDRYAYDTLEDRTRLHFWREPSMGASEMPALKSGCASVIRFIGQLEALPKYARYFGQVPLQNSARLTKWMNTLHVCQGFESLYLKIDERNAAKVISSETIFGLYYT